MPIRGLADAPDPRPRQMRACLAALQIATLRALLSGGGAWGRGPVMRGGAETVPAGLPHHTGCVWLVIYSRLVQHVAGPGAQCWCAQLCPCRSFGLSSMWPHLGTSQEAMPELSSLPLFGAWAQPHWQPAGPATWVFHVCTGWAPSTWGCCDCCGLSSQGAHIRADLRCVLTLHT